MLVDLHCHYPMHLLGGEDERARDITLERMVDRHDRSLRNKLRAALVRALRRAA